MQHNVRTYVRTCITSRVSCGTLGWSTPQNTVGRERTAGLQPLGDGASVRESGQVVAARWPARAQSKGGTWPRTEQGVEPQAGGMYIHITYFMQCVL